MKTYDFHGSINPSEIGKEIRTICKKEKTSFKLLTGYGSTSGTSKSKSAALMSLSKLKKENIVKDYFSGDVLAKLQTNENSYEYKIKQEYGRRLNRDRDYGNDGVIFVFLK